ncbi:MAG: hypothetical protein ACOC1K_00520 [Nanoarchaeota archaeon]
MYLFKLPIGDWSGDGHEMCEEFIIESNVSAEDLVPIYIEMDKEYNLSSECQEYKEESLSEEFLEFLEEKGLDPNKYLSSYGGTDNKFVHPQDMAQLIIDLLMLWDDSLKLKIKDEEIIPSFNNHLALKVANKTGGRELELPGYGLFKY